MKKSAILLFVFLIGISCNVIADDYVMFNYQGRVKVQGQLFDGTGYFKFAIVNNPGNTSLWSNDLASSGGNEPTGSITVQVDNGIFNVTIGDPALGMEPINRTVFNHPNRIKLRIWFSDGTHGFQRLLPDRRLHNVELMGMVTGDEDFTIYVNGTTGNDENNGLTTDTAKKTIQTAVDVLPAKLECNVTIDIADGVYREPVDIVAITAIAGKSLTLLGDEDWTPSSPGMPSVRITGNDNDITDIRVRDFCLRMSQSTSVKAVGILCDGAGFCACPSGSGGGYSFENCVAKDSYRGFTASGCQTVNYYSCISDNNDQFGYIIIYNTHGKLTDCQAINNTLTGLYIQHNSSVDAFGSGNFSNNGSSGIMAQRSSFIFFNDGYSGTINNNSSYGLLLEFDSFAIDYTKNTFSGNGGILYKAQGGNTYTW